jgi:hypothetical protein
LSGHACGADLNAGLLLAALPLPSSLSLQEQNKYITLERQTHWCMLSSPDDTRQSVSSKYWKAGTLSATLESPVESHCLVRIGADRAASTGLRRLHKAQLTLNKLKVTGI